MVGPPTGIKIISVLYYISVGLVLLLGFFSVIFIHFFIQAFSPDLSSALEDIEPSIYSGALDIAAIQPYRVSGMIYVIIIAVSLLLAALYFFIARALWRGKPWARIAVIIFSGLGVIGGFIGLVRGSFLSLIILAIDAFIVSYLLISTDVKEFFYPSETMDLEAPEPE